MSERTEFLVYVLVDDDDNIWYVGRGTHGRAHSHDPNNILPDVDELRDKAGNLRTLVVDCETEHAMIVTEGVLISALKQFKHTVPLANRRLDKYKFFPPRVPIEFEGRSTLEVLSPLAVSEIVNGPVLYVHIKEGPIDHEDHDTVDPLNPQASAIANRIEKHWALDPWVEGWRANPATAPRAIIGLSGPKRSRYILGALDLEGVQWPPAVGRRGAGYEIPWAKFGQPADDNDIDAFSLCGRRFDGISFSRSSSTHVFHYDSTGQRVSRD